MGKKSELLMAAIFFAGGLILTGVGLVDAWSGLKSYLWDEKEGVIISSEVRSCGRGQGLNSKEYRADIFYRYSLNGYELNGDLLYSGYQCQNNRQGAQDWVDSFPAGTAVTVYVNPDKPKEAVLVNGIHLEHIGRPLAGLLMAWLAVFMFFKLRGNR
ncbi:DUF3592 domain-containing protein [Psychromonas aquimarina]|uniref:DUF3592 domain-containing protein n=1 Tax=Psychromonas aquimarina TaxID=444919 RepID=UPI0003F634BA|nr:DUF3592 domain-containing protein [Psychromonas aquimarina]